MQGTECGSINLGEWPAISPFWWAARRGVRVYKLYFYYHRSQAIRLQVKAVVGQSVPWSGCLSASWSAHGLILLLSEAAPFYGHRAPLIQFHTNSHKSLISRPNKMFAFALCLVFSCFSAQCVDVDQNRKNNTCDWRHLIDMPLFDPSFVNQ